MLLHVSGQLCLWPLSFCHSIIVLQSVRFFFWGGGSVLDENVFHFLHTILNFPQPKKHSARHFTFTYVSGEVCISFCSPQLYRAFQCYPVFCFILFFFPVALRPNAGHGLLILEVFLDYTQRRTTVGRTPLDK